ncbi:acyl-CoA dehydrogenase family protein [Streptomyces sp. NPDC048723]|uniref:acyl-CoA dehydrogenase family protein n=1 Tax=unclassified Streptomyces TaxID=2593676 RepID=UPI000A882F35
MSSVEEFRTEVRGWLRAHLTGEFAGLKGRGGPGPTLIDHGTEEHKRRFLPPVRAVEELWCQGYGEPGAGSDLAAVRTRATALNPATAPSTAKPYRSRWHRDLGDLGELAMDVCAAPSLLADGAHGDPYDLDDGQRLFLFSRAGTIYAGSDEIQRNLIAERILGLPKEVRA